MRNPRKDSGTAAERGTAKMRLSQRTRGIRGGTDKRDGARRCTSFSQTVQMGKARTAGIVHG